MTWRGALTEKDTSAHTGIFENPAMNTTKHIILLMIFFIFRIVK